VTPRTLIRHSQVRRAERVDSPATEDQTLKGRYFQADCLATDSIGVFVRILGNPVSGVRQVRRVDVTDQTLMPAVGVIVEKTSLTRCLVQIMGEVIVDPENLVPGKRYFIGRDSELADAPPDPVIGEKIASQVIGIALEPGILLVVPNLMYVVRVGR